MGIPGIDNGSVIAVLLAMSCTGNLVLEISMKFFLSSFQLLLR